MAALFCASVGVCWVLADVQLAVAVCLAYLALTLRMKHCSDEMFTHGAVEHINYNASYAVSGQDRPEASTPSQDSGSPLYHVDSRETDTGVQSVRTVYDSVTSEVLRDFITPEHLNIVQTNTV